MSYAFRKDGQGWRAVNGPEDIDSALEDYMLEQPVLTLTADQLKDQHNLPIKTQLNALDAKAGRAVRDALLALAASLPAETLARLQVIEDQAAALRSQLQ